METPQPEQKNPVGRPSVRTRDVARKLEEAAEMDATVVEMCLWADISRSTYYEWMQDDPEFLDRLESLRSRPILNARRAVTDAIAAGDVDTAFKYLERKKKDEFAPRQEHAVDANANLLSIIQDDEPEDATGDEGAVEGSGMESTELVSDQAETRDEPDTDAVQPDPETDLGQAPDTQPTPPPQV